AGGRPCYLLVTAGGLVRSSVVSGNVVEQAQSLSCRSGPIVKGDRSPLAPPRPIEGHDEQHERAEDDAERDRARGGLERKSRRIREPVGDEQQARESGRPDDLRVLDRHIAARKRQLPVREKQRLQDGSREQ